MKIYDRMVEEERARYFSVMSDSCLTQKDVLTFHIEFDGPIYSDQIDFLYAKLALHLPQNDDVASRIALTREHLLHDDFLRAIAPELAVRYFSSQTVGDLPSVVLPDESANELMDKSLLAHVNLRSHFPRRATLVDGNIPSCGWHRCLCIDGTSFGVFTSFCDRCGHR